MGDSLQQCKWGNLGWARSVPIFSIANRHMKTCAGCRMVGYRGGKSERQISAIAKDGFSRNNLRPDNVDPYSLFTVKNNVVVIMENHLTGDIILTRRKRHIFKSKQEFVVFLSAISWI